MSNQTNDIPDCHLKWRTLSSPKAISAEQWNQLAGDNPTLQHAFFSALHESGCVSEHSGWQPHFISLWENDVLIGVAPLYLKYHSYGEYVFDWAWAEAYHRHDLKYYPKLLCAVPFTPVAGARLLAKNPNIRQRLLNKIISIAQYNKLSSFHCLFPHVEQLADFESSNLMIRHGLQFHWHNPGYTSFEQFLNELTRDKRKKIRQERRKVHDSELTFRWLSGPDIGEADWSFFYRCYVHTYQAHRSTPYLNLQFFQTLGEKMPENILLILVYREGKAIAATLNLLNEHTLYGRYWGALEFHSGLHFETCYYQAIEYCIARNIKLFEGGAQGEHKLARGFLPTQTYSVHWIAHPQFAVAIGDFLREESFALSEYEQQTNSHSPFKI